MAVHFDIGRMEETAEKHEMWWSGKLDRPLIAVRAENTHAAAETACPVLSQANCPDFTPSPEEVIDAIDASLSRQEYLGDAFPWVKHGYLRTGRAGGALRRAGGQFFGKRLVLSQGKAAAS